jgi:putative (di)nucleoside polyphosphate hydrolase
VLPYRECVAIFLIKDSKIFAGRRIDIKDAWQPPQGGVEPGESYLDAAKRELLEETGIKTIELLGVSSLYKYDFPPNVQRILTQKHGKLEYRGQKIIFFAFKFLGEEKEINLQNKTQEFVEWQWMALEDLLKNIVYFKKISYKQAVMEFQKLKII